MQLRQIAKHVAKIAPAQKTVLIDAFAGAGGSTIQFALSGRWERIFAVEKDPEVLKCAKRNAEIYGVSKKIWWIHGDCFDVLKSRFRGMGKEAVIFASPPWGGEHTTPVNTHEKLIFCRPWIHLRRHLRSLNYAAVLFGPNPHVLLQDHQRDYTLSPTYIESKPDCAVRSGRKTAPRSALLHDRRQQGKRLKYLWRVRV
jgi:hypothetical protein